MLATVLESIIEDRMAFRSSGTCDNFKRYDMNRRYTTYGRILAGTLGLLGDCQLFCI